MSFRPSTIAFLVACASGWVCLAAAEKPKVSGYTVTAEGGVEGTQVIRYDAEGRPIDPSTPLAPKTTVGGTRPAERPAAATAAGAGSSTSSGGNTPTGATTGSGLSAPPFAAFAGATIMGDGRVALILDISALIKKSRH